MKVHERLRQWLSGLRKAQIAFKGSRCYGRTIRLRRAGNARDALETARRGLALLSAPGVLRHRPAEGSALLMLTIQVEQLAHELGEPGASPTDLFDAATFLRAMPDSTDDQSARIKRDWLPYMEARLASVVKQRSTQD